MQSPALGELANSLGCGTSIEELYAKNIGQSIQDTKSGLFIIVSPVPNAHR